MGDIAKKDRIIVAALKLFSNNGYHKTTVSQIAKEAEVAKGTVYWYFDSKKQLFQAILLSGIYRLIERIKYRAKIETDVIKQIEIVVNLYLEFFDNSKQYSKMFQEGITVAIDKEFKEKMTNINKNQIKFLADIINKGRREGIFKSDIDIEDTAQLLIGMINSFHPHIYNDNSCSVISKGDYILKVLLKGITG